MSETLVANQDPAINEQAVSDKLFDKSGDITPPVENKPAESNPVPEQKTETKAESKTEIKDFKVEDLKLPEGLQLPKDSVEKIASYAREQGFSKDKAQELLNLKADMVNDMIAAQQESYSKTREEWVSQVKNDQEIGGNNFKQSIDHAQRALKQFASDEFIKTLNETGYGDHPEVVRVFARIGKMIGNDTIVQSNNYAGKKLEDVFYKNSNN